MKTHLLGRVVVLLLVEQASVVIPVVLFVTSKMATELEPVSLQQLEIAVDRWPLSLLYDRRAWPSNDSRRRGDLLAWMVNHGIENVVIL